MAYNCTSRRGQLASCAALTLICSLVTVGTSWADAESEATSKGSDWFGTNSGWITERIFHGRKPEGDWGFQYKHWFGAAAEPGWTTHSEHEKPDEENWDNGDASDSHTTTAASSSTASSEWQVDPYSLFFGLWEDLYSKSSTRSKANASSDTKLANSKTRITDPIFLLSPELDPTFIDPLDPDGLWEIAGHTTLFGEIAGTGAVGASYAVALDSNDPVDAHEYLNFVITDAGTSVVVDLPDGATNLQLYIGNHASATLVSANDLEIILNSYLTPTGWALSADLALADFLPDQDAMLDQVFSVFSFLQLDSSVSSATVYTEQFSFASAEVPEPHGAALVALGFALLGFRSLSRRATGAGAAPVGCC